MFLWHQSSGFGIRFPALCRQDIFRLYRALLILLEMGRLYGLRISQKCLCFMLILMSNAKLPSFLDRLLGRIDGLITKTQLSIDLLKKTLFRPLLPPPSQAKSTFGVRMTASAHQEKHFEDYVVSRLKAQGWKVGDTKHYDTEYAPFMSMT